MIQLLAAVNALILQFKAHQRQRKQQQRTAKWILTQFKKLWGFLMESSVENTKRTFYGYLLNVGAAKYLKAQNKN